MDPSNSLPLRRTIYALLITVAAGAVAGGIIAEDGWKTIDKVLRPDTQEFYSSKPPLLATLVAGEYWLLKQAFGWSIVADRFTVIPFILLTINVAPLVLYLALLGRLADTFGA